MATEVGSSASRTAPLLQTIEEFLESRRIDCGAAEHTLYAYRADLLQFAASLPEPRPFTDITASDLDRFLGDLHARGQKPASIGRRVASLRQFFKFCCLEKGLSHNPAEQLHAPRPDRRLPKHLSGPEVETLLATVEQGLTYLKHESELRARDRAILYLLYASGLRVSELIELTPHQVDLVQGYVRIKGKGDKERIAPFAPAAGKHLADYLETSRPRLVQPGVDAFFVNHRGGGLTRQAIWQLIQAIALQAGLGRRISPHMLRHSFATHLLASGINLRSLQMLLGHSDISTTQIYAHVAPEHLQKAHRRFHPRGGGKD